MKRWKTAIVGLGLALGSLVCNADLRVAYSRTPLTLPFHVIEQHRLLPPGAGVVMQEHIGGHRCMEALVVGQADLATVSDMVIMSHLLDGGDLRIYANLVTAHDDVRVVARGASGILAPSDLAGKGLGYVPGTASEYFLEALLLLNGLDTVSAVLVPLQPEDMPGALNDGRIDAASLWQPFAQDAEQRLGDDRLVMRSPEAYTLHFVLVGRTLPSDDLPTLAILLRALLEAIDWIQANPREAGQLQGAWLAHEFLERERSGPRYDYRLKLDQALLYTLENLARWRLYKEGRNPGLLPDWLDVFSVEPLQTVSPHAVTLVK